MGLNWLNKIFNKKEQKEWLKPLYENIEHVWLENKSIKFKIVEIKKSGFQVKVGGLFAYLPFSLMPWDYNNVSYWNVVGQSLEGATFYGKIAELKANENKTYNIIVDATIHLFLEISLQKKEKYTGIVLHVFDHGLLVDVGSDFDWKCGSIIGFVSLLKFKDYNSSQSYETGDYINVVLDGKTAKGFSFAEAEYFDLYAQYVGKTAWAKIYKNENSILKILVEDKYQAMLPKKYFNRNKMEEGTIIQCQVISINTDFRYLKLRAANTVLHSHSILDKIDAATVEKLRKQYVSI